MYIVNTSNKARKQNMCIALYLNEKKRLKEEVKEHVCDDLTDAGERLSLTARNFKS